MRLDLSGIDWMDLLPRFGVDAAFLSGKQCPCPICGGKDRFRFDNIQGQGTWYCNKCEAGNGLTLVAKVNGWDNRRAAREIHEKLGNSSRSVVAFRPGLIASRDEPTRDELRSKLQRVWDEAVPIVQGDPVWRYLHNRIPACGALPSQSELRHHPALEYFECYRDAKGRDRYRKRGKFPAMLAKVRDVQGRPATLHRTYLTADGRKAEIPSGNAAGALEVKKLMPGVTKYTGGAVRLYPPDGSGRLGTGEGIETMLAVRAAYKERLPVWPCLSAVGLKKFAVPEWVTELHIFADNDRPDERGRRAGQEAASALLRRAVREGFALGPRKSAAKRVFLHLPKREDTDFLDEWIATRKLRAA